MIFFFWWNEQKSAVLFLGCRSHLCGTSPMSPPSLLSFPPCSGMLSALGGWPVRWTAQLPLPSGSVAFGQWGVPAGDQRRMRAVHLLSWSTETSHVPENSLFQGNLPYDTLPLGVRDFPLSLFHLGVIKTPLLLIARTSLSFVDFFTLLSSFVF